MPTRRFGEKLRTLRERRGLSLLRFARQIGFQSQSFVYKLETGERNPNMEHLNKIAKFFGVSYDELLDDEVELRSE